MGLDAIAMQGIHTSETVPCLFCPAEVRVPIFVETGSGDRFIDFGGGSYGKGILAGKLFTIVEGEKGLDLEPYHLARPWNKYFVDYYVPDFGLGVGNEFWICSACVATVGDSPSVISTHLNIKYALYAQLHDAVLARKRKDKLRTKKPH